MTEPSSTDRPGTALRRLKQSVGVIASTATARMEEQLPWYRQLSAEDRSWIGLIVQAGIRSFISWAEDPKEGSITADVFGTAPQKLTRVITLQQTVEMVRMSIEVIEGQIDELVGAGDAPAVRELIMLYGREVAFGTAEVYARAAEMRGAWDARLEALVVDSVLRGEADEAVRSRAAALGWESSTRVVVVLGRAPGRDAGTRGSELAVDEVRRAARGQRLDALCAVQGDRLVVVLGGVDDPDKAAGAIAEHFGTGPVVVGPMVADLLAASVSARAAIAGLRAASGWPAAPRPVSSDDLLPERALAGDGHARRQLVQDIYVPLVSGGATVLDTTAAFLEVGGSIEATARALFVHPNTVRYRLRRVAELTGLSPTDVRHAYTLRLALTLGRLSTETAR
ncbi:MAG TPA: helix-turn-helix domain-containing protein [Nocardioidaceae bacterium]|nr:helix-turn-helix domain-containing protein [Nocardioidaceae bacterium]